VLLAHREPQAPPAEALVEPLHAELLDVAHWLGLNRLSISHRGELARDLVAVAR
jgi:uncharacterized protein YcaQ